MGDFQPLASPEPLDTTVADRPASLAQQGCNLAIAVTAILASQLDHIRGQTLRIGTALGQLPLGRAMLAERRTGATLGYLQLIANVLNADTATRGA